MTTSTDPRDAGWRPRTTLQGDQLARFLHTDLAVQRFGSARMRRFFDGALVGDDLAMAAMHDLDLPHDRVNVHVGACALGHPLGASGARIMVTLLAALEKYGRRRGIAALCIGGGEATAIALERFA